MRRYFPASNEKSALLGIIGVEGVTNLERVRAIKGGGCWWWALGFGDSENYPDKFSRRREPLEEVVIGCR